LLPGDRRFGGDHRDLARARQIQLRRQGVPNALLSGREIEERSRIDGEGLGILRDSVSRFGLSARAHHRVLKVARTIADLEQSPEVRSQDVAEALRYRGTSSMVDRSALQA